MRKIRASKCEIREVPTSEQREFLNKNHVQGYTPCSLCLGLYLGNELVYLQSYGNVRRDNIHYATWDMKRMCGPKDAYVYGGASKLLKYFLNNYDLGKGLVTYCDPEVFDGHTYEKIGFTLHHICADDYKYIKDGVEYNKQHGKKSNIWKRLKKENPDIEPFDVWKTKHTEREMMEKLGYERVMHKGLIAYTIGTDYSYQIYKVTFEDGKTYVGQHKHNKNDPNDEYITSSTYYKEGHKVTKKEILLECKDEITMDIMETICILGDKAENGDNNVNGNLGGMMNVEWGKNAFRVSTRKNNGYKISQALMKLYSSEKGNEVREKMRNSKKELYNSEKGDEIRKKMSESKKKLYASEKGNEVKEKMSEYRKTFYISEEGSGVREKISESLKTFYNSEEGEALKQKYREAVLGKHLSDEVKEKISKSNSGKCKSEEHKSKIKKWVNEHKEERSKAISNAKVKYLYRNVETGETHTRPEWREKGVTRGMLKGSKYEKILK